MRKLICADSLSFFLEEFLNVLPVNHENKEKANKRKSQSGSTSIDELIEFFHEELIYLPLRGNQQKNTKNSKYPTCNVEEKQSLIYRCKVHFFSDSLINLNPNITKAIENVNPNNIVTVEAILRPGEPGSNNLTISEAKDSFDKSNQYLASSLNCACESLTNLNFINNSLRKNYLPVNYSQN